MEISFKIPPQGRCRPWSRMVEAVVVVMGCACVLGPQTPLKSKIQFILWIWVSFLGARGFGCLFLAAQTRERWQFLSVRGGAPCKTRSGWMARAQGWSQVKSTGKRNLCVCAPHPQLWSACSAWLFCLCVLQGGSWGAIPCAALPAMCPCLIRGHRRLKISFLSVLGLHFLNHLALSFVFSDGNNSTSSKGQDRCFPSRGFRPLSWMAFK